MTPSQVLETVRNQVDESSANFWSDNEIRNYMWEAEKELASLVHCSEKYDASTLTVNGTAEYGLPTDCYFVERVVWNGVRLKKIDFRELELNEGFSYGKTIQTGLPDSYYLYAGKIGIYPTPQTAYQIKIWYQAEPAQITENTGTFTIDKLFHNYICHYVLWQMWSKDQESDRCAFFRKQWDADLAAAPVKWAEYKRGDRLFRVKDEDQFPVTNAGMI
jgi:hypothetical protein